MEQALTIALSVQDENMNDLTKVSTKDLIRQDHNVTDCLAGTAENAIILPLS
jgi:hypothetical protein